MRAPLPPAWHFAKAKASSRYRKAGLSVMGATSGILVGVYLFIPVRLYGAPWLAQMLGAKRVVGTRKTSVAILFK